MSTTAGLAASHTYNPFVSYDTVANAALVPNVDDTNHTNRASKAFTCKKGVKRPDKKKRVQFADDRDIERARKRLKQEVGIMYGNGSNPWD